MTNAVPLNSDTATKLKELYSKHKVAYKELARVAASVRNQNLASDGKGFSGEFNKFWKDYELEDTFKSLSNFTKYAGAGDVLSKFDTLYADHIKKLPDAVSTLYEISLLENYELRICLENTYSRTEVTADEAKWRKPKGKAKPLIHSDISSTEIRNWKKRWRSPVERISDRKIPLLEIKVDSSLFEFRNGEPVGSVSLAEVEHLIDRLKTIIGELDNSRYSVNLNEEQIREGYNKKKNLSEGKKNLKKKTSAKKQ